MNIRDKWKELSFFRGLITELNNLIEEALNTEELEKSATLNPRYKCDDISSASAYKLEIIHAQYSYGYDKQHLQVEYNEYMQLTWKADSCYKLLRGSSVDDGKLFVTPNILSTIVYAECLGFDRKVLERFAKCIPSGIDQLVDRLLSHYQADRKISDDLTEKAKYKQLVAILDMEDKKHQAKKLKNYLDQWPKKLGIRAPDGIRPLHETPTYDGYWCYEAAAVVIVADIDDESFKDHEFYPTELMNWRKE